MADERSAVQIYPGRGLGWMTLGASLHGILSRIKAQPQIYPQLDLLYSAAEPIHDPIVLNLPLNGIRLRFDGPDQRLRLIEILDFSKTSFTYKTSEIVRRTSASDETGTDSVPGPSFRHIYNRLFGPSYAGEYLAPDPGYPTGTYVLSYPGLAIRFPLRHKSWSDKADFVSLLSSSAAYPATSIAIFSGSSWPEARSILYNKQPTLPRSISLANKGTDNVPDEIEEFVIHSKGSIELVRRSSPSITITLHETTPQDLTAELGPPDAIFRKSGSRISIHAGQIPPQHHLGPSPSLEPYSTENDRASAKSYTDDSDTEVNNLSNDESDSSKSECFYNYFHHGFDALVTSPQPTPSDGQGNSRVTSELVITKLFLHGNVPGSFSFNRHRRSRWRIRLDGRSQQDLTSEMRFNELSAALKKAWQGTYASDEEEKKMQRGMVLNRGWGESPESSVELLGGFEEAGDEKFSATGVTDTLPSMNNTELFGFPGLLFEVLKNDTVTCLTIY